ncbi:MAG: hypothetical protein ACTSUL_01960 [Promethearchaeota archaeon]
MDKNLKELIDSIDSANQFQSNIEELIREMRDEIQRLNFRVNEQKKVILEQQERIKTLESEYIPDDIKILRDLVRSQREEILKREKDVEILENELFKLREELETYQQVDEKDNALLEANERIAQLIQENERLRIELSIMHAENSKLRNKFDQLSTLDYKNIENELIEAKKKIFKITEENGVLRIKVESLKQENKNLQAEKEKLLEENKNLLDQVKNANDIVKALNEKVTNYEHKISSLNDKFNDITYEKDKELTQPEVHNDYKVLLENKIKDLEYENENLIKSLEVRESMISDLKEQIHSLYDQLKKVRLSKIDSNQNQDLIAKYQEKIDALEKELSNLRDDNNILRNQLQEIGVEHERILSSSRNNVIQENIKVEKSPPTLFLKMYNNLSEESKINVLKSMMNSLKSSRLDVKLNILHLLSLIKNNEVISLFRNLLVESDWMTKLYILKLIQNMGDINIKEFVKPLLNDPDPDIREVSRKLYLSN